MFLEVTNDPCDQGGFGTWDTEVEVVILGVFDEAGKVLRGDRCYILTFW